MHVIFVQVQSDRRVNCERNNRIKRHTNLGGMYTNVVPACKGDDEQKQFDWPDSIAIGYVHARVHEGQWSSRVRISGEVKNSNNQKKTEFAIVDQLSRDCVAHVMQLSQHQRLSTGRWTLSTRSDTCTTSCSWTLHLLKFQSEGHFPYVFLFWMSESYKRE